MKTPFKNHIKLGSCWYDNFFKTNTRQRTFSMESIPTGVEVLEMTTRAVIPSGVEKCGKDETNNKTQLKNKNHELKK
jgi:hypothetical protein